ncbi:hypothetical protein CHS0354_009521 [Potamilus streckersoni]|uniref:Interferon-induced protein 44-like n=1 Tax=Potamilus streckersoni TaxID=2493646 RepID=A0AAE0SP31_9BIVA|nr:hypothetical protein CHS0354_009521 [Potamilus streckersoni]
MSGLCLTGIQQIGCDGGEGVRVESKNNERGAYVQIVTKHQYHIRSSVTKSNLNFCLCDTCGIEDDENTILENINYLLDGSVPEEYEFNASVPINPNIRGFRKRPGLDDQVHVVAFVIDGSTAEGLSDAEWEKFKNLQTEISKRGIPRVILLTKVDKLCTAGDISKVFESCQVDYAVKKVSAMLGIPLHNVHPIKNYEKEMSMDNDISHLALIALEQMITFASDYLERKCLTLSRIKPWRLPSPDLSRERLLTLMDKIKTYSPPSDLEIPFARILMIGPADAGKSSFFNTINSVFTGRIAQQIIDGGTTAYRQYQIQTRKTVTALKFRLCDTSGVEKNPGSYLMDLMYVIAGNVPDGYKFTSSSPINPDIPGFKIKPGLNDKVFQEPSY